MVSLNKLLLQDTPPLTEQKPNKNRTATEQTPNRNRTAAGQNARNMRPVRGRMQARFRRCRRFFSFQSSRRLANYQP